MASYRLIRVFAASYAATAALFFGGFSTADDRPDSGAASSRALERP